MPSLSLQTLLVSYRPQLPSVSVDPRGFKSALQSLTQFLIEQEVQATLWLKLPKDDAWWTDVWAYGMQAEGCTLYTLGEQIGKPPENLAASLRPLATHQDDDLKREYLCMAIASNFVCVLLAVRNAPGTQPAADKRTIQLYCSTSGATASAISEGLKNIVESSLQAPRLEGEKIADGIDGTIGTIADGTLADSTIANGNLANGIMACHAVYSQWNRCFPAAVLNCETLPLAENFLSWQLQKQELLRSQLSTHRSTSKNESTHTLLPNFLSKAGQELQSPLTTIKTALTLLGSPTLKMAQRQRYLEMISTQCDRQKSLINNIINLLKIQTTPSRERQPIQLADLIPGIVSTYQPIAEERGIMLAYTIPPNLKAVLGIESELKEVVIHLINNGIEITPKGGRVWVAATPHEGNFIALTVQDSGAGISQSDIAQLFEPFYRNMTSKDGNTGSGLGLTLVQQLLKRMGGSIVVESVPSRGTTFTVLLPIHRVNAAANTSAAKGHLSHSLSPSLPQTHLQPPNAHSSASIPNFPVSAASVSNR